MAFKFRTNIDGSGRAITNFTFDVNAGSNAITNIEVADLAAAAKTTNLNSSALSTQFATADAIKSYADGLAVANDAMVFKGATDCSGNPNYPTATTGHTYKVSVAGKIGGASGVNVEVGDMFICTQDTGYVTAIGATTDNTNGTLVDGTYTNGGAGYASTTSGSGSGATFNVTIASGTPTLVLNSIGKGYSASDTIVVAESTDFSDLNTGTLDSTVSTVGNGSGNQATSGSYWVVIQSNIDGAVIGPASATDTAIALFNGTSGKLIKNSLVTVDSSGSVSVPTGQAYEINSVDILTATGLASTVVSSSLTSVGTLSSGNATAVVDAASTTAAGKIEIATAAESITGTDNTRATSPLSLASFTRNYTATISSSTGSTITGATHGITTVLGVFVLEDDGTNYFDVGATIAWAKATQDVTWSIETTAINVKIVIFGIA
jgi:hypothetical protein